MELEVFEKFCESTDISKKKLWYYGLGLTGEAGEFAEKVKKIYRDFDGEITQEMKILLAKELFDVLWYLVRAANILGISIDEVIEMGVKKLSMRKATGTLSGSGDTRELK